MAQEFPGAAVGVAMDGNALVPDPRPQFATIDSTFNACGYEQVSYISKGANELRTKSS